MKIGEKGRLGNPGGYIYLNNNYSIMIKAILFDYDGVIVDSFENVFKVYRKICKLFKVPCPSDIEEFRKVYGYNYFECLKNLGIDESNFAQINDIYKAEISKMENKLFPGIKEVIHNLSQDYDLYLVSASFKQEIIPKLKGNDIFKEFKEIYSGGENKIRKHLIVANILEKYNYNVGELIFIGDRNIDYDNAKKVGFKDANIILTSYGWGFNKEKVGDAKIANNPNDILDYIKYLSQ